MCKAVLEFIEGGSEILVDKCLVRKIDDESFIFRIGSTDQVQGGRVHGSALVPHGTGIINDDAHRNRNVLVLKRRDGLGNTIFKDMKIVLGQIIHQPPVVVEHCGIQYHFIHIAAEGETTMLSMLQVLGGGGISCRIGWIDRLVVCRIG